MIIVRVEDIYSQTVLDRSIFYTPNMPITQYLPGYLKPTKASEEESTRPMVIPLMTNNTPNFIAAPGLEINNHRDINVRIMKLRSY